MSIRERFSHLYKRCFCSTLQSTPSEPNVLVDTCSSLQSTWDLTISFWFLYFEISKFSKIIIVTYVQKNIIDLKEKRTHVLHVPFHCRSLFFFLMVKKIFFKKFRNQLFKAHSFHLKLVGEGERTFRRVF